MNRTICILTTTRADYGLLRPLMQGLREDPQMDLQIIATGMHLSPEFGMTVTEIEKDGFTVDSRPEILLSADTGTAVAKTMGLTLLSIGDELKRLQPDVFVVLGDRFESFAATAAATACKLPIAHIHGGETTIGAMDEAFRHSMTKMAHLHFTSTEEYRRRVIQLGEEPDRVFTTGAPGIDSIKEMALLSREELQQRLDIFRLDRNLMVTFHPATLDRASAVSQFRELLKALGALRDTGIILTRPNADSGGRELFQMIDDFVNERPDDRKAFVSMGHLNYLSAMAMADAVVGNSSSGIIEAPSFRVPTVNIGDRQAGRVRAPSVVDCAVDGASIREALRKALSPEFRASLGSMTNPYGDGGASRKIKAVLEDFPLEGILKKRFHDVPVGQGEADR